MEQILYTVKQVAKIMHTNPVYVYQLISTGALPALKLGSFKIRHEALESFFKANEGCNPSDPTKHGPSKSRAKSKEDYK